MKYKEKKEQVLQEKLTLKEKEENLARKKAKIMWLWPRNFNWLNNGNKSKIEYGRSHNLKKNNIEKYGKHHIQSYSFQKFVLMHKSHYQCRIDDQLYWKQRSRRTYFIINILRRKLG